MIKKIRIQDKFEHRHIDDVKRIQVVLLKNGYDADLQSCASIWEDYSDSYAAGWLGLPESDDELFTIIGWRVDERCK